MASLAPASLAARLLVEGSIKEREVVELKE